MLPPCLNFPASLRILSHTLFTRCCWLQCATVMNVNYQRFPNTEQLITAKISGNVLKQVSRTQSVFFVVFLIFGDSNWRQAEAWNVLLAGAVEVNALAQGALRQFTQWIEHPTLQLGGGHLTTELLPPHIQCYVRAVHNCKNTRLRECLVDHMICGWDGGHPGLTVWNLSSTQELRMCIKRAKIFSFFIM